MKAFGPLQVAGTLRVAILDLHERHLAIDGSAVDYPGIKKDPAFAEYVNASTELQHVSLASMSEAELKVKESLIAIDPAILPCCRACPLHVRLHQSSPALEF